MRTSYILFPILFLPSPSHHAAPLKKNNLFKIQSLLKTSAFKFLWVLYHILTLICIHFQHQMNPVVLEWSCSLPFPLGTVNYNPQNLCYFLVHIFFGMLQEMTVLITGFVGRFWQSKSCPAITNPFQAQVAPSNRWSEFIFLLFCEWLSHFYATVVTLHGK